MDSVVHVGLVPHAEVELAAVAVDRGVDIAGRGRGGLPVGRQRRTVEARVRGGGVREQREGGEVPGGQFSDLDRRRPDAPLRIADKDAELLVHGQDGREPLLEELEGLGSAVRDPQANVLEVGDELVDRKGDRCRVARKAAELRDEGIKSGGLGDRLRDTCFNVKDKSLKMHRGLKSA